MTQDTAAIESEPALDSPQALTLKPAQRQAILALLEYATVGEAAQSVDRHERTLYRWLRDPVFRRCLDDAFAAREASLQVQAMHEASEAFSVLGRMAGDKHKDSRVRVSAARHVLEYTDRQIARRRKK